MPRFDKETFYYTEEQKAKVREMFDAGCTDFEIADAIQSMGRKNVWAGYVGELRRRMGLYRKPERRKHKCSCHETRQD